MSVVFLPDFRNLSSNATLRGCAIEWVRPRLDSASCCCGSSGVLTGAMPDGLAIRYPSGLYSRVSSSSGAAHSSAARSSAARSSAAAARSSSAARNTAGDSRNSKPAPPSGSRQPRRRSLPRRNRALALAGAATEAAITQAAAATIIIILRISFSFWGALVRLWALLRRYLIRLQSAVALSSSRFGEQSARTMNKQSFGRGFPPASKPAPLYSCKVSIPCCALQSVPHEISLRQLAAARGSAARRPRRPVPAARIGASTSTMAARPITTRGLISDEAPAATG